MQVVAIFLTACEEKSIRVRKNQFVEKETVTISSDVRSIRAYEETLSEKTMGDPVTISIKRTDGRAGGTSDRRASTEDGETTGGGGRQR